MKRDFNHTVKAADDVTVINAAIKTDCVNNFYTFLISPKSCTFEVNFMISDSFFCQQSWNYMPVNLKNPI